MLYNTFLAATGGAGYTSCNKMIMKSFYQETVLCIYYIKRQKIVKSLLASF